MSGGSTRIAAVIGRRLFDGQGYPALEAEVRLANGAVGRAIVGTPRVEPFDDPLGSADQPLVDGGAAFGGRGLDRALALVETEIAPMLAGRDAADQGGLDRLLAAVLAGGGRGPVLARAGANATLAVSIAAARAGARSRGLPLWRSRAGETPGALPVPIIDVLEADPRHLGCRRISLLPIGAGTIRDAFDWCSEAARTCSAALARMGPLVASPRGAWMAPFEEIGLAVDLVVRGIEQAGLVAGEDIALALDIAAGAFGSGGAYLIGGTGERLETHGMIRRAHALLRRAPVVLLEDALAPDAGAGWPELARTAGQGTAVVMRSALGGVPVRIAEAAEAQAATAAALKPGRMASVSAIGAAVAAARGGGLAVILEAGAAESEDDWLAELALAFGADLLSPGGVCGSARTAKWNTLLRLGDIMPGGGRLNTVRWSA